jgi:hypothetical protein
MRIEGVDKISGLPQPAAGLLPAVHDATVESYDDTDDPLPTVAAGQVFQNDTSGFVVLPAYGPWPASRLAPGAFAACDGRFWYPASQGITWDEGTDTETNSYYPSAFDRTIYSLAFSAISLPLRQRWELVRQYDFRMFSNTSDAVWNVIWEIGDRTAATTPAPVGPNIKEYEWRQPLIDEQVHLTDVASRHLFGVVLQRVLDGTDEVWSGEVTRYGMRVAAQDYQLPTSNDFVLRLRLGNFDTLDTVAEPKGYAAYFVGKQKPKE